MTTKMFRAAALAVGVLMCSAAFVDQGFAQQGSPGTPQDGSANPAPGNDAASQKRASQPAGESPATQAGQETPPQARESTAPRPGRAGPPPRRVEGGQGSSQPAAHTTRPPSTRPASSRPPSRRPPSSEQAVTFTPEQIQEIQQGLNERGFSSGKVDGILGPQTSAALRQFQEAEKLPPTGRLDARTAQALGVEGQVVEEERQVLRRFDADDPRREQWPSAIQNSRPETGIISSDPETGIEPSRPFDPRTPEITERAERDSGQARQPVFNQPLGQPLGQSYGAGPQSRPYTDPMDRRRDPFDTMSRPWGTTPAPWR